MPPSDAAWQQKLAALRAHVAAHGRPPPQSDASSMGDWVHNQRQAKKAIDAGRKCSCKTTPARAAALEGMPGLTWEVDIEAAWEEKLVATRACVAAHGWLPRQSDVSGQGKWASHQRQAKKAMEAGSKMTPECAAALEAVPGWAWHVDVETALEEKLAALRVYVGVHGRLPPQRDVSGLARGSAPSGRLRRRWTRGGGASMAPGRLCARLRSKTCPAGRGSWRRSGRRS
jgi:hypothetical protein